jgi:ribonuclease D
MSDETLSSDSAPLNEPRLPVTFIESDSAVNHLVEDLRAYDGPICIDAERASGFRYGQKAYLIQIAIPASKIYLIDPTADFSKSSWHALAESVNSKPWIIHAATQDLACLAECDLVPTQILDTELASRILGLPRVALGTITEHYLNLKLAKEHSAVDWSIRPLPNAWLDYAALDVDVLFDLWKCVEQDLIDRDRMIIAEQEFAFLLLPSIKEVKNDRWRAMNGLHEIKDQRSLTVAKYLWEARETLAIEKDISPGRLIPDSAIIAAVKAAPRTKSELASLRTFSGRASRTYLDVWWKALSDGTADKNLVELRVKSTGIPNHRNWSQKFPEANARLLTCKALIAKLSSELKIPSENIISPEVIRGLCFEPPTPLDFGTLESILRSKRVREWQIKYVSDILLVGLAATSPPQPEAITETP